MKKLLPLLSLIFLFACSQEGNRTTEEGPVPNPLQGNWAFLDKYGNYNEAFFGDSSYFTFNRVFGPMPSYKYLVKNDTLYSAIRRDSDELKPVASLKWFGKDSVVIIAEFGKDTLTRLPEEGIHLGDTDLKKDSAAYVAGMHERYEDFLIKQGILTREEIEAYRDDSVIPPDVMEELEKRQK